MDLKRYCKINGIKQKHLAKALGITPQHLSDVVRGRSRAGVNLAERIETLTKGGVSRIELLYPKEGVRA